jgi:hypothetical protein
VTALSSCLVLFIKETELMYTWTLDVSNTSERDRNNLLTCYRIMTGNTVLLKDNFLTGKCKCPSELEGQSGIEFYSEPLSGFNLEGLNEEQKDFLEEYILECSKPVKITRHLTYSSSKSPLPDTLIDGTTFCEGYGNGVKGTVIFSPHTHLIGTKVKLDGRSNVPINQYGTCI